MNWTPRRRVARRCRQAGFRKPGGGRKRARDKQPGLSDTLAALVEPTERGDPEHPLRWTCKSTSQLAAELRRQGFHTEPDKLMRSRA